MIIQSGVRSRYPLVNGFIDHGNSPSLIGESTVNGACSIAMFNYQGVVITKGPEGNNRHHCCLQLPCIVIAAMHYDTSVD